MTKNNLSIETLMRKTAWSLVRDFQDNLMDPSFAVSLQDKLLLGTANEIRECCEKLEYSDDTVATFKATYQLKSFFKRFRFRKDIYDDKDLLELSLFKFLENQSRLREINLDKLDATSQLVLMTARNYVSHVLGPYDAEEHRNLCRFGKRASVGIPSRKACEAERWELPISGSQSQISWFEEEISSSPQVQKYLDMQIKGGSETLFLETDYLTLTFVPKTFKSLRAIVPNTTIGTYSSSGLGAMIAQRLKRNGHDIRSLQHKHKRMAASASYERNLVTADQSMASDNITRRLVEILLPKDWFDVLDRDRISKIMLPNGQLIESLSFCGMGIGYTFPLQTLVFLSLLKALNKIYFHKSCLVSVYGDDMIYSNRLHQHVKRFFPNFGLVLNEDKTFSEGWFRESCGGDYFHGMDVRPFQPQLEGALRCTPKEYEAILYKIINGLLLRWSEDELRLTLSYLTSELIIVAHAVSRVPCDYPDDSGIKCSTLNSYVFLRNVPCKAVKHLGHGLIRFVFLKLKPRYKEEKRHEPYLWACTRGDFADNFDHLPSRDLRRK